MKTAKKILSSGLAALMLIGMIPLNASAAGEPEKKGSMTLTVGTVGETFAQTKAESSVADFPADLVYNLGYSDRNNKKDTMVDTYVPGVNGEYTASAKGSESDPYEVSKGGTVLFGIDISAVNPAAGGFTTGTMPVLEFVPGSFTSPKAYVNPIVAKETMGKVTYEDSLKNYTPGATGFTATSALYTASSDGVKNAEGEGRDRVTVQFSGGTGAIPNAASWDAVVEMTASGNAGLYEVKIVSDTPATNSDGKQYTAVAYNEAGWKNDGTGDVNDVASDGVTTVDNMNVNSVWVKITSSEPTVSLVKTSVAKFANRTLDIKLEKGTFANELIPTDFVITQTSSGAVQALNTATVTRVSDTVARITFDASAATVGETYKVAVNYNKITPATGTLDTNIDTGNFTISAPLDGTVTITGTAKYGEDLTADWTGTTIDPAPTDVAIAWYKDTKSTFDSDSATKITAGIDGSGKLTLGRNQGITYGTDYIFAVASSAAQDGTTVASTGSQTAKAVLTMPATSQFTGTNAVPSIMKDANPATVTGTYTFTDDEGLVHGDTVTVPYVGTYADVSAATESATVSVAFGDTLGGTDAANYYTATAVLSQTLPGVTGKVTEAGYEISLDEAEGAVGTVGFTTLVVAAGDTGADVDVTGLKPYEQLDPDYTFTTANGGTVTVVDRDTFHYVNTNTVDTKVSDTIKLKVIPLPYEIKDSDLKAGGTLNKPYDGTKAAPQDMTVTFTVPTLPVDYSEVGTVTITGTFEFTDEVSTTKTLTLTNVAIDSNSQDAKYYSVENVSDSIDITLVGPTDGIRPIGATSLTADAGQVNAKTATLQDVKDAVNNALVYLNNIMVTDQGDVQQYVSDADLMTAIQRDLPEAYIAAEPVVDQHVEASVAADDLTATQYQTGMIVLDNLASTADTVAIKTPVTGFTVGGTNNQDLLIGTTAVEGDNEVTLTITPDDGTDPYDITITVTVKAEPKDSYDFTKLSGDKVLNLTYSSASDPTSLLAMNVDGPSSTATTIDVKINFKKPSTGGSTGGTVTVDTKNYGSATTTEIEIDENGKIVGELPEVVDVVKGAVFLGWSKDGTKAGIIDPEKDTLSDGATLQAVYEGYMAGDNKNHINAGQKVTRAELMKMVLIASGKYDASEDYGKPSFTDAQSGWYVPYLACAEKEGIAEGYPDKTFKPDAPVTREEAAKMIAVAFDVPVDENATVEDLTDFGNLQKWAKGYVAALYGTGAVDGYPDGTYRGNSKIGRDESAKMTNTFLGLDDDAKTKIKADESIEAPFTDMVGKGNWAYADLVFASLSAPADYYGTDLVIPER